MKRTRPDEDREGPEAAPEFYFQLLFIPDATGRKARVDFSPAESVTLRAQSAFFESKYAWSKEKTGKIVVDLKGYVTPLDLPPKAIDLWRRFLAAADNERRQREWKEQFDETELRRMPSNEKIALFALFDVAMVLQYTVLAETVADILVKAFRKVGEHWFRIETYPSPFPGITYYSLRVRTEVDAVAEPVFDYLFPTDNNTGQHGLSEEARQFMFRRLIGKLGNVNYLSGHIKLYLMETGIVVPNEWDLWVFSHDATDTDVHIDIAFSFFDLFVKSAQTYAARRPALRRFCEELLTSISADGAVDEQMERALLLFEHAWNMPFVRDVLSDGSALDTLRINWSSGLEHAPRNKVLALLLNEDNVFNTPLGVPSLHAAVQLPQFNERNLRFLTDILESPALRPDARKRLVEMVMKPNPFKNHNNFPNAKEIPPGYVVIHHQYELAVLVLLYEKGGVPRERLLQEAKKSKDLRLVDVLQEKLDPHKSL